MLPLDKRKSVSQSSGLKASEILEFKPRKATINLMADVILPDETRKQLMECLARLKFHEKIYQEWDFASVDPYGKAAILNFYGPPGVGKTMCAEAMAHALGRPIIHTSVAEISSRYMGDTAKNLQSAFSAAYQSRSILFFDEADTLLGKRLTSVTSGIDSEINAMRSTMLIELEKFDGMVVFASNFVQSYDEAFRSRITHHVGFSMPDEKCRFALWDRMLAPKIPLIDDRQSLLIECVKESENMSGREIRNCMRLALPKMLLSAEKENEAPGLRAKHILECLQQIKNAYQSMDHKNKGTMLERLLKK